MKIHATEPKKKKNDRTHATHIAKDRNRKLTAMVGEETVDS